MPMPGRNIPHRGSARRVGQAGWSGQVSQVDLLFADLITDLVADLTGTRFWPQAWQWSGLCGTNLPFAGSPCFGP